jgi:hypothetical protein
MGVSLVEVLVVPNKDPQDPFSRVRKKDHGRTSDSHDEPPRPNDRDIGG